jgi:divalent metal cation (Fe/Co/Zn/Cd) transporter
MAGMLKCVRNARLSHQNRDSGIFYIQKCGDFRLDSPYRARWVGHRVYSDIAIEVDPKLSVGEGDVLAQQVEKSLNQHLLLLGKVVVRICPASGSSRSTMRSPDDLAAEV